MRTCKLFISYSHKDVDYLDQLKEHINNDIPNLEIWDDVQIELGDKWDERIKGRLSSADVALLLISPSFLSSKYVREVEISTLLNRNREGKCKVIPIFIRAFDTEDYPEITSIQGVPSTKTPLSTIPAEKDGYYVQLRHTIKRLAASLGYEPQEGIKEDQIRNLKSNTKIFLSISTSKNGIRRRNGFINQALGRLQHKEWKYGEIVPTVEEANELLLCTEEERTAILALHMKDTLYAIHIMDKDNLTSPLFNLQYEIGQANKEKFSPFKNIIWLLDNDIEGSVEKKFFTNPCVKTSDYESVFDRLEELDLEKGDIISKVKIGPKKRVYMFYDFSKDHNNRTRVRLKLKLEEKHGISVLGRDVTDDKLTEEKKIIEQQCQGAIIFYGESDQNWYKRRQDILIFEPNLKKAVCIDEPKFKEKVETDIWKNELDIIRGRGENEFETDSDIFINQLKSIV